MSRYRIGSTSKRFLRRVLSRRVAPRASVRFGATLASMFPHTKNQCFYKTSLDRWLPLTTRRFRGPKEKEEEAIWYCRKLPTRRKTTNDLRSFGGEDCLQLNNVYGSAVSSPSFLCLFTRAPVPWNREASFPNRGIPAFWLLSEKRECGIERRIKATRRLKPLRRKYLGGGFATNASLPFDYPASGRIDATGDQEGFAA